MSQEALTWLNQNCLIGFSEKRGHAWHYKASEQGDEPNHYPGEIPVEDVRRRLFDWQAVEGQLTATALTPEGVLSTDQTGFKAIMRSDSGAVLGVFKGAVGQEQGYRIHQYEQWLLEQVATLIDDELQIGSAGLLRGGAVAWVSIEMAENVETPEGVTFRPHLVAATSHDGSLATTYKRSVTLPVCDNTLSGALIGTDQRIKVRHSRYSDVKLQEARDALQIVHSLADDFSAQVAELCATTVTDKQWDGFLGELLPMPDEKGRSRTMAENKREAMQKLWDHDNRVSPWRNTAFGVVQAANTAWHHEWNARGDRAERNQLRALDGTVDRFDHGTVAALAKVLDEPVALAA